MNIVVAMKQIPDLQQVRIRNRQPVLDGVPMTFGSIDKNALETALQLKEAVGGNVIVISAGTEELEDTVKEALAAGADEAYLVLDDELEHIESSVSAHLLAELIKQIENIGIILFGEGSGDNYSGQVGPRIAEILGLPEVGYVCDIELEDSRVKVTRSLEDCEEVVRVSLPAVLTVMADINEPRIPSVTQILKAGKKPQQILEVEDIGFDLKGDKKIVTLSSLAPENKRKQITVKNGEELVDALLTEGVIRR